MRRTLPVLLSFAAALAADPLSELAEKQRAAIYDAREEGLRDYVAEVTSSAWKEEPALKTAKLILESAAWRMRAEGLPEAAGGNPTARMVGDLSEAVRALGPLTRRVDALGEGYRAAIRADGGGSVVEAARREGGGGDAASRVVIRLDGALRTTAIEEFRPDGAERAFREFSWERERGKSIATGYALLEGGRTTRLRVEYDDVGGFALPGRVRLDAGGAETLFTFVYRSVNGQPVSGVGPFGTPEATARAFLAAAAARDAGMVGKCFSSGAADEFRALAEGRAGAEELEELAAMFGGGRVLGVAMGEDGKSALVRIACRRGGAAAEESFEMLLDEEREWRIADF